MNRQRGQVRFEWAVLLVLLGVLVTVFLQRVQEIQDQARRVQLRMGLALVRSNAQLLQAQCPGLLDRTCIARALAQTRRVGEWGQTLVEATELPPDAGDSRLLAIASAAGLTQHAPVGPQWQWQAEGTMGLRLGLKGVSNCHFLLRWDIKSGASVVEDIHDSC